MRSVNRNNRRPAALPSLDALLAAVDVAIIDDPKHAAGRAIGLLLHKLERLNQPSVGSRLGVSRDRRFWRVGHARRRGRPRLPCTRTRARCEREWQGQTEAKRASDVALKLKCSGFSSAESAKSSGWSLPNTLIKVEDRSRHCEKRRITRESPASITPRSNGVLARPAPDGGTANLLNQPLS